MQRQLRKKGHALQDPPVMQLLSQQLLQQQLRLLLRGYKDCYSLVCAIPCCAHTLECETTIQTSMLLHGCLQRR